MHRLSSRTPGEGVRTVVDLSGNWEYRADPRGLGEHYQGQLAYTHRADARWMRHGNRPEAWAPVAIPGPWPVSEAGDAAIWFRRSFRVDADAARWRLEFDGVNYRSDVWLNGHYLGTHEGYFSPFSFDVTDSLASHNSLVVRVTPASDVLGEEDQMGQFKRDFIGALGRWDMNNPERTPAGIWAPVRLVSLPVVSVNKASIQYEFAHRPDRPDLDRPVPLRGVIAAELVTAESCGPLDLKWSVAPVGFPGDTVAGATSFQAIHGNRSVSVDVELQVRPWWTWDLGEPRLYDIEVHLEKGGELVDAYRWRTGFRELSVGEGWDLKLNGVSLYQRGANYLSDLDLSTMTSERYARDIAMFKAANLNTVHPFCVVEAPEMYAECDCQGLIVYQDFPLWLMADGSSEMVTRALIQFDEMVELLDPHPSMAIWNFGSQPSLANFEKLCVALVRRARQIDPGRIAHHGNAAVSYKADDDVHPTRSFFWKRSEAARFEMEYGWRRDTHMYPGWYFGGIERIADLPREDFGLVTEFGGQSLPGRDVLEEFVRTDGPIDWTSIALRCGQPNLLRTHNLGADDLDALVASSQAYQAELVRHHTEFIRSLKGAPGRGLHLFAFNDCWPSVTWSVVDYYRTPKPAYAALALAMEPVQAFLQDYMKPLHPGTQFLDVAIVNDGPHALEGVNLTLSITKSTGSPSTCESVLVDLPTDQAISRTVAIDVPFGAPSVQVELTLAWDGGTASNHYSVDVSVLAQTSESLNQ